MQVSSISSSGRGSTKTSRSVGAGSTSGRRGMLSSSMCTTATRSLSRLGFGDSRRLGDSLRCGDSRRLGDSLCREPSRWSRSSRSASARRSSRSPSRRRSSSSLSCSLRRGLLSCLSPPSPRESSRACRAGGLRLRPREACRRSGLRLRSREASPCENLQRLPRLQRPRLKSLHISTSRRGLRRLGTSPSSLATSSAFCSPFSVSNAMFNGLPATFCPRSSLAASFAEAVSRKRTRAAPWTDSPSSVCSMSMPINVLGFTAPWSSAEMSEEVQRPGKSLIKIAPPSCEAFTSSAGGSQSSMLKTLPSPRASTAALATSGSAKAAIAFIPWSMIWGDKVSVPKTSSSWATCEESLSEGIASHSRGKSVIVTCCPRATPSLLPRRVFGQSRMRCPRWPQMWHSRSSLPTGSRPSGCV
mmetsp:Transcript_71578/g.231748  ORF Transcript_71578/g.231748 Transcript_71578/m.231748 type:complete len:415 (+) Transcript_71578:671-1915(+)